MEMVMHKWWLTNVNISFGRDRYCHAQVGVRLKQWVDSVKNVFQMNVFLFLYLFQFTVIFCVKSVDLEEAFSWRWKEQGSEWPVWVSLHITTSLKYSGKCRCHPFCFLPVTQSHITPTVKGVVSFRKRLGCYIKKIESAESKKRRKWVHPGVTSPSLWISWSCWSQKKWQPQLKNKVYSSFIRP